jgi:hypothetical protein
MMSNFSTSPSIDTPFDDSDIAALAYAGAAMPLEGSIASGGFDPI